MPHSSGGGSSGGGFHSGSSSSGPTHRTSSRPFPGAFCYVYYDRRGRAKTLYTNQNPKTAMRIPVGTFLLLGFLALVPAAIIPIAGNHAPTKLPTNYVHTIQIQDNLEVLSKEDKATLQDTFQQFFDLSGICPGLISVSNATWKAHYPSLESYALQTYLSQYSDESHWLIVYAADNNEKSHWAFEGMQGNDTDGILPRRVTDVFNKSMVAGLDNSATSVGSAIDGAFRSIMPTLMDHYFYVEPAIWAFCAIWEVGIGIAIASTAVTAVRNKNIKTATKIDGSPNRKRCPYCGNEYIEWTIDRCPKCQAMIDDGPKYAHFPKDGE